MLTETAIVVVGIVLVFVVFGAAGLDRLLHAEFPCAGRGVFLNLNANSPRVNRAQILWAPFSFAVRTQGFPSRRGTKKPRLPTTSTCRSLPRLPKTPPRQS